MTMIACDRIPQVLEAAITAFHAGRLDEARVASRQLVADCPANGPGLAVHGAVIGRTGAPLEGLAWLARAAAVDPASPDTQNNYANLLLDVGATEQSIAGYRRAIVLAPGMSVACQNLGILLFKLSGGCFAELWLRRATVLDPSFTDAWANIAIVRLGRGALSDARSGARRALVLQPTHPGSWATLGGVDLREMNPLAATRTDRRLLAAHPGDRGAWVDLICAQRLIDGVTAGDDLAICRRFAERFVDPLIGSLPSLHRRGDPYRKLRIGYIGADTFRFHTTSMVMLPPIERHDREVFDVYCYSDLPEESEDYITARLRHAAIVRVTRGLTDLELSQLIRADRIDVLVDVCGYSTGSRLLSLACRPAPVQVNLLLMGSFGIKSVGWAIGDHVLTPLGSERNFVERLHRIDLAYAYDPLGATPAVSQPPSILTFGCFNQPIKISPRCLRVWAEILRQLDGARLVLKGKAFDEPSVVAHIIREFKSRAIDPARIELRGLTHSPAEHLHAYRDVSIALDTFPYCGVTTTCEAMWMGVPVVSLLGGRVLERYGGALLSAVGLSDLAAESEKAFIDTAVALGRNPARLSMLRGTLREQVRSSPLHDSGRFALALEEAYRTMWQDYCAEE